MKWNHLLLKWRGFCLVVWNVVAVAKRPEYKRVRRVWIGMLVWQFVGLAVLGLHRSVGDMLLILTMLVNSSSLGQTTALFFYRYESERKAASRQLGAPDLLHISMFKTCPDCVGGALMKGPRGGASMNVKCNNRECRHEFSLAFHGGAALMGERIDRDDASLYDEESFV